MFKDGDDSNPWTYAITEEQVEGYNKPKYFTIIGNSEEGTGDSPDNPDENGGEDDADEPWTEHPYGNEESIAVSEGNSGGVKIVNDMIVATLPSTGGPGNRLYTVLGFMLTAFAGICFLARWKKRRNPA